MKERQRRATPQVVRDLHTVMGVALFLVLFASCTARYANVREITSIQGERLVIVSKERADQADQLGYIDHQNHLLLADFEIDCRTKIGAVIWSPSGKYFLVESFGEGDQGISIYEFAALQEAEARDVGLIDGRFLAYRELDPYRHGLSQMKWIDDETLQFQSVGDFNKFDKELRRGYVPGDSDDDGPGKTWRWNIKTDRFESVMSVK
jgi:hypothetical protein